MDFAWWDYPYFKTTALIKIKTEQCFGVKISLKYQNMQRTFELCWNFHKGNQPIKKSFLGQNKVFKP